MDLCNIDIIRFKQFNCKISISSLLYFKFKLDVDNYARSRNNFSKD